jgi:pyruvate,orthophosphate dikinase
MSKYVYTFGDGKAEGGKDMKNLLGGKGANLAEMSSIGVPVPPGFTISTEMCTAYYENNEQFPEELTQQVEDGIAHIEEIMGAKFGDNQAPLLVSVRSGARVSMPGMMDTILNLGLNPDAVEGLAKQTNNPRFAWDSYRRFVQMYGDVVMGVEEDETDHTKSFEGIIEAQKKKAGVELDTELSVDDLKELVTNFKAFVKESTGTDFPDDPKKQLWGAIGAVFGSWMNDRAIAYRKMNNIPAEWGTAVNVQAMVFGNMGDDCATGVAFTRDPSNGEKRFYGEFLINAQGEDVVAGVRTPQQINNSGRDLLPPNNPARDLPTLEEMMPDVYSELETIYKKLEKHYRDMQDLEFTIQQGKLWLLQTRNGKRTARAALKIAVDMVEEGLIDKEMALMRLEANDLFQLLLPEFDKKALADAAPVAHGLPAVPGAAAGKVVFFAEDAEKLAEQGERVVLVRVETSPEDIKGMSASQGILTARGGMTSHAAVVARGWGKCCIAGCGALNIDYKTREMKIETESGELVIKEGDYISLNGTTGNVYAGDVKTVTPDLSGGNFGIYLSWADEVRRLKVRTNADTPQDAQRARDFGAQGIGLCRTEHMFFEGDRIWDMREMIMANTVEGRKKALAKLKKYQVEDFYGIFKAMHDLPVTVRTLDPPLHEFLPQEPELQEEMAKRLGISVTEVHEKVEALHEFNPMMGHRGCRLGITYPEITEMQCEAIIEAACKLKKEGINAYPEIMIPLIGTKAELKDQEEIARKAAKRVMEETGVEVPYLVGTMIEIPRAALTADEVAEVAEFFSFGTNDLTQMTFGYSRDDAQTFIDVYTEKGILPDNPFETLDQTGVGQLVDMACQKGKKTRPDIKLGICGEHGGDPRSIDFCHRVGLAYVSCSPFRVPTARLAAAQAVLKEKGVTSH